MMKKPKKNINIVREENTYFSYQTEPSSHLNKKNFSSNIAITEFSNNSYLDYTFISHRNLIFGKTKDPKKIRDYNFDLEQTLNLNLEILLQMDLLKDKENEKEIKELIKKIKAKTQNRTELNRKIKSKKNDLVNRKQAYEMLIDEKEETKLNFKIQYEDTENELKIRKKYIKLLSNNFKDVQKYIDNLRIKEGLAKDLMTKITIQKFIKFNNHYTKEIKLLNSDIKKLNSEIIDIKKTNQLYKEEIKIDRTKSRNKDLIRVMEFYRRIILSLQTKIKVLRNSFENMTKTLNYLNLGDIVHFQLSKKELSTTHFEINFDDLNEKENDKFDLIERANSLMDFNDILNNRNY